ncbi:MAG: hypothetical protein CVV51_02655 [Spirochaetae bacterium HGW-Spirochaetae-7]|nr:MAG: hypothetical protein CVV51_02655 [Spirochaetae bacterium HGW-Spirochaetae-7]
MPVKAMDLFDAYTKNMLPSDLGFIVSSYFSAHSAYSRYEIVSYNNVKSIYPADNGLTFQTDGKKLHILIEPSNYPKKGEEPYVRSSTEMIPQRFSELELHTCKNQTKIYWGKAALMSYTSFTIMKPMGVNFSFIFYSLPDVYDSMTLFFEKTFNKEAGVPMADAKKVAKAIGLKVKESMSWEYSS